MAKFTAHDTDVHATMTDRQLEAEYLRTMALLKEVLDYLLRLPPHPMTRSLADKLHEHLDHPVRQLQSEQLARTMSELNGCNFTPAGLPIIRAVLNGTELKLTAPLLHSSGGSREMGPVVLGYLKKGERIELRPTRPPFSSD
jgi:hypothetical protein